MMAERYVSTVQYASIFAKKYGTLAVADPENFGGGMIKF